MGCYFASDERQQPTDSKIVNMWHSWNVAIPCATNVYKQAFVSQAMFFWYS